MAALGKGILIPHALCAVIWLCRREDSNNPTWDGNTNIHKLEGTENLIQLYSSKKKNLMLANVKIVKQVVTELEYS